MLRVTKPCASVTHLVIHSEGLGYKRDTLWCQETVEVTLTMHTTEVLQEVTCKRCIALGGCGPNWPR